MNLNLVVIEGILKSDVNYDAEREEPYAEFIVITKREKDNIHHKIVVANKLAEVSSKYLEKGSHVLVSGYSYCDYIEGRDVRFLPKSSKENSK